MAGYLARRGATKRKRNLAKSERKLRSAIENQSSSEQLNRAAEEVRDAQLGVIKCLIYEMGPHAHIRSKQKLRTLANLEEKHDRWIGISTEEILHLYGGSESEEDEIQS